MQQPEGIAQLILAFMAGTLSDSQATNLAKWREESADHEALFQKLTDQEVFWNICKQAKEVKEEIWDLISESTNCQDAVPLPTEMFLPLYLLKGRIPEVREQKR